MSNQTEGTFKILVVERRYDGSPTLADELSAPGHRVRAERARDEAVSTGELDYDLLVSDLEDDPSANISEVVRAFKLAVLSPRARAEFTILHEVVKTTLSFKRRCIDQQPMPSLVHEMIDLEVPSDLALMNTVLEYLLARVDSLGLVKVEQSNLYVALDEAFVNAVKHGNRNDPTKLIRVTAELSPHEAIFTIEDEGEGFDVREIPDPCDAANLFKSTGRGVLLIYNIMDEVEYSEGGARLRMVKRPENAKSEPPAVAGG